MEQLPADAYRHLFSFFSVRTRLLVLSFVCKHWLDIVRSSISFLERLGPRAPLAMRRVPHFSHLDLRHDFIGNAPPLFSSLTSLRIETVGDTCEKFIRLTTLTALRLATDHVACLDAMLRRNTRITSLRFVCESTDESALSQLTPPHELALQHLDFLFFALSSDFLFSARQRGLKVCPEMIVLPGSIPFLQRFRASLVSLVLRQDIELTDLFSVPFPYLTHLSLTCERPNWTALAKLPSLKTISLALRAPRPTHPQLPPPLPDGFSISSCPPALLITRLAIDAPMSLEPGNTLADCIFLLTSLQSLAVSMRSSCTTEHVSLLTSLTELRIKSSPHPFAIDFALPRLAKLKVCFTSYHRKHEEVLLRTIKGCPQLEYLSFVPAQFDVKDLRKLLGRARDAHINTVELRIDPEGDTCPEWEQIKRSETAINIFVKKTKNW